MSSLPSSSPRHPLQVNIVLGGYPALARHLVAIGCPVAHPPTKRMRVISVPPDLTRIVDVSLRQSAAHSPVVMSVSSKDGGSFDDNLSLSADGAGGEGAGGDGSALQQVRGVGVGIESTRV